MSNREQGSLEKFFKIKRDRLSIFIGKLTVEILWPRLMFGDNYKKSVGIVAQSMILFQQPKDWAWHTSLVVQLLGFGIGAAWNHVDNPNSNYVRCSMAEQLPSDSLSIEHERGLGASEDEIGRRCGGPQR